MCGCVWKVEMMFRIPKSPLGFFGSFIEEVTATEVPLVTAGLVGKMLVGDWSENLDQLSLPVAAAPGTTLSKYRYGVLRTDP